MHDSIVILVLYGLVLLGFRALAGSARQPAPSSVGAARAAPRLRPDAAPSADAAPSGGYAVATMVMPPRAF